jgi:hypothetical protein
MRKLCFALLAAAAPAFADVEAGNWELTVTTAVDGMPGALAPVTRARCITPEEARDPSRLTGGAECQFSNRRDSGSEITFDVSCGGPVPMRGSGSVRYLPQSIDGTLDISADAGGQKIMTRSRIFGRRLGAC